MHTGQIKAPRITQNFMRITKCNTHVFAFYFFHQKRVHDQIGVASIVNDN
jgi:hypothetical protein